MTICGVRSPYAYSRLECRFCGDFPRFYAHRFSTCPPLFDARLEHRSRRSHQAGLSPECGESSSNQRRWALSHQRVILADCHTRRTRSRHLLFTGSRAAVFLTIGEIFPNVVSIRNYPLLICGNITKRNISEECKKASYWTFSTISLIPSAITIGVVNVIVKWSITWFR